MPRAQLEQYSYAQLRRMSVSDLLDYRVKLAKRSNQRLVRLERSESPVTGKPYRAGAYDLAMEYLKSSRDKAGGKLRFSESRNYTKEIDKETGKTAYDMYRIKRDILEMQTFLASKSSTVSGSRAIEQKRIETFESQGIAPEVAGSDLFYDFLNSNAYEYFTLNQFTSEEIIDIYNTYREAGMPAKKIQKAFDDLKARDQQMREADEGEVTLKDVGKALDKKASKKTLEKMAKQKGGTLL